jgi:hypothetical protein
MDVRYFLGERLAFTEQLYVNSAAPFIERKRKIEAEEENRLFRLTAKTLNPHSFRNGLKLKSHFKSLVVHVSPCFRPHSICTSKLWNDNSAGPSMIHIVRRLSAAGLTDTKHIFSGSLTSALKVARATLTSWKS